MPPPPLLPPTEATLREAALAHLARYSTSRLGLTRVLDRRIERWARQQGELAPETVTEARTAARVVVAALAAAGVLDDAAFAATRTRRLVRAGRSGAAMAADLAARGVDAAIVRQAVPDDPDRELAAALTVARRRRLGPFRDAQADTETRRREMAVLARAGFSQAVTRHALHMAPDEAEAVVLRLRRE